MPRSVPASFRSVGANVSCVLGAHGQRICWAHAPFSGHAFTAASPRLSMITDDFRCFDLMLFGCVLFHESHSNHLEAWNIQYHPIILIVFSCPCKAYQLTFRCQGQFWRWMASVGGILNTRTCPAGQSSLAAPQNSKVWSRVGSWRPKPPPSPPQGPPKAPPSPPPQIDSSVVENWQDGHFGSHGGGSVHEAKAGLGTSERFPNFGGGV